MGLLTICKESIFTMKALFIIVTFFLLGLVTARAPGKATDIKVEKCEDVLAEKICADLRAAAEKLKVKAKEIDALVRQAVEKKISDAKEIVKQVRQQLVDIAKTFTCED